MCICACFCLRPVKPIQKRNTKATPPLLLQKAIAWKKMPEWCFEFLEGPITETQPTELRQLASGASWWQTGGGGRQPKRTREKDVGKKRAKQTIVRQTEHKVEQGRVERSRLRKETGNETKDRQLRTLGRSAN